MEGDAALESSLPGVAAWRGGQAGETSKLSCPIIVGFFDNVLHAFTVCLSYLNDINCGGN
jgi:hypothetical protein